MTERNLPWPGPDVVDDGVPATEEVRDEVLQTGQPGGVGDMPMGDRPWGAREPGTTAAEHRHGESLSERLAREQPDVIPGESAGVRVYEPGADEGLADIEADVVAELDPLSYDTLSPEESAMSVRDDPGGLTYGDPGYLSDDEA